ncbi:hypothetical protein [Rummeliibacillus sp. BSL5]
MFIRTDENNMIVMTYNSPFDPVLGLGKTREELEAIGYFVDEIPPIEHREGKIAIQKFDGKNFYVEYEDAPVDEMTLLKNELENQKQALAELMMFVATLTPNV